jgi:hypothetical protein
MKSDVCGILDPYGGLRFVVDQKEAFCHHTRIDELCFVIEGLQVEEPVPWEKIPWLIATIERCVGEWIRSRNDPAVLEQLPIKMYLIRCTENPHFKRSMDTDAIVMG